MDETTTTSLLNGSASGDQGTTNNPQSLSQSTVQTGTSGSVLTGTGGIGLSSPSQLPSVPLSASSLASTTPESTPLSHHHSPNPVLLGITAILFICAIILFVTTSRSAKITTKL